MEKDNILEKYPAYTEMMRKLRYDDYEISLKLSEMEDLAEWEPITYKELKEMSEEELLKLKSYCWHDGQPRCDSIGITNVSFEKHINNEGSTNIHRPETIWYKLEWSDTDGGPSLELRDDEWDSTIDNVGDGTWNYGLYRKKSDKNIIAKPDTTIEVKPEILENQ